MIPAARFHPAAWAARRRGRASIWYALLCLGLALGIALGEAAFGEVAVPRPQGPVTDLTQTLTTPQTAALQQRLNEFEAQHGSQIVVLLVPTTQPETIEQYSIRVVESWRPGRKGVDDGLLLLVAKNDRAVRIEVGYGLEGVLPDAIANRITDQVIVPRFRDGDYYGGLEQGVSRIMALVEGEPLPVSAPGDRPDTGIGSMWPLLLLLVFVGGGLLKQLLGTLGGASLTAGLAGLLVWVLTSALAVSLGAAVIAFLFTLIGGGGGSGWTNSRGPRRPGGWSGGGGGWSGGGGGWSGGGGSFGGGGATGRW